MGRCGHRPLRTYLKFRAQTRKKPRPEAGAFIYFLLLFFLRGADDMQLVELLLRDLARRAPPKTDAAVLGALTHHNARRK